MVCWLLSYLYTLVWHHPKKKLWKLKETCVTKQAKKTTYLCIQVVIQMLVGRCFALCCMSYPRCAMGGLGRCLLGATWHARCF